MQGKEDGTKEEIKIKEKKSNFKQLSGGSTLFLLCFILFPSHAMVCRVELFSHSSHVK